MVPRTQYPDLGLPPWQAYLCVILGRPTVYPDLSSKINLDNSIDVHGHITGGAVLGFLDKKINDTLPKRARDLIIRNLGLTIC